MKGSYEYKRFMRDGSVKLITAVIRSKQEKKIARRSNAPR
jgi:hypothetical protein